MTDAECMAFLQRARAQTCRETRHARTRRCAPIGRHAHQPHGSIRSDASVCRERSRAAPAYDSLSRVSSVTTTIDTAYTLSTSYDAAGRVETVTYPNGYAYRNVDSAYGYLTEVRQNGAAGPVANQALLWGLTDADAQGRARSETNQAGVNTRTVYDATNNRLRQILAGKGSGVEVQDHAYVFDTIGRLSQLNDTGNNLLETFDYGTDGLNRLRSVTRTGAQSGTDTVTYDASGIGNIATKSGVGTYTYNASGPNSVRPHAVASITGTVYGFANPSFNYDNNGNLTGGLGRTVAYTSFNLPSQIQQRNAAGTLLSTMDFTYDSDYGRIKQVNGGTTTIYLNPRIDLGGTYTNETTGSTVTHRWVVYAGGRPVMEMQRVDSAGTWKPRWYHTNHLGSLIALSDENGTVVERLSYDAWGKRRNLNGAADANGLGSFIKSNQTTRGYTLHEHLEAIALVHMNGRIYDPMLARLMQADPVIQAPGSLQSYNRYSYVLNNPLILTDPSGFSWWTKWRRTVFAAVAAVVTYGTTSWLMTAYATTAEASTTFATFIATDVTNRAMLTTAGEIAAAASAGFVAGGIQGGTLESALQGGITAGVFAGVTVATANSPGLVRIAAKSAASAGLTYVQGGDWRRAVRFAALTELGRVAWEAARDDTDRLYAASCGRHRNCSADEFGAMTDGGRTPVRGFKEGEYGRVPGLVRSFMEAGMDREGSGTHFYDRGQWLCSVAGEALCAPVRQFYRWVSKPHDFGNSWSYDRNAASATFGDRIEGGGISSLAGRVTYEVAMQSWSLVTMPAMATFTTFSLFGDQFNPYIRGVGR